MKTPQWTPEQVRLFQKFLENQDIQTVQADPFVAKAEVPIIVPEDPEDGRSEDPN